MNNDRILELYNSPEVTSIYGFMYGLPYVNVAGGGKRPDKIIEIDKSSLILGKNKDCFVYVWGWPGPDSNIYRFSDYGVTWAYSKDEIED